MKAPSELMHDKAGPDTVVRVELLEGVRGLLASWVMVGHFIYFLAIVAFMYQEHYPLWMLHSAAVIQDGVAPVALFMIISGFVISHLILSRREIYKVYITRRFLRLFPAFLCCFIIGIFVSPIQSELRNLPWGMEPWVRHQADLADLHRAYSVNNIVAHLTLLHGLIPKTWWPDATGAYLGVGWSISTEWQFYLIAPLLIWATRKLPGLAVTSLILICLSPSFPFLQHFEVFTNETHSLLVFHIQYFFIGGVSYQLWRMWREYLAGLGNRARPQGLILCGLAIAFFTPYVIPNESVGAALFVPNITLGIWVVIFACLCQIAAKPDGIEARVVQAIGCSEPAQFIGRISYSVYLVHWPVAIVMLQVMKGFAGLSEGVFWGGYMLVTAAVTIGISTVLYYFVEAPAIRWGKKIFKEDRPAPDVIGPVKPRKGI